jgi:hypothetical protein
VRPPTAATPPCAPPQVRHPTKASWRTGCARRTGATARRRPASAPSGAVLRASRCRRTCRCGHTCGRRRIRCHRICRRRARDGDAGLERPRRARLGALRTDVRERRAAERALELPAAEQAARYTAHMPVRERGRAADGDTHRRWRRAPASGGVCTRACSRLLQSWACWHAAEESRRGERTGRERAGEPGKDAVAESEVLGLLEGILVEVDARLGCVRRYGHFGRHGRVGRHGREMSTRASPGLLTLADKGALGSSRAVPSSARRITGHVPVTVRVFRGCARLRVPARTFSSFLTLCDASS